MSVKRAPEHASDFRFPRQRRLLKPEAFSCVFRHGFRSQDALFTLLAVTNDDAPRIGLAVSRKVSPTAVGRNRIKRQVRESFRTHQGELPGLDIVVMARRDTAKAGSDRLRHSLEKHWRRLITQCDPS